MRANEVSSVGSVKERRDLERGFTLMETSIAMLVLMIAAFGVVSLFAYSIRYNSGADDRAIAISVAQQQLEQFRSVAFNSSALAVSSGTVSPVETTSNGRTYRITKTVSGSNNDSNGNPTLKTVTIRVDPISPGWAGFPVILRTMRAAIVTGTY